MLAAAQQPLGTMPVLRSRPALPRPLPSPAGAAVETKGRAAPRSMNKPRQFYIHGVTHDGRTFRPSDWAERLAGAMASFRPGGSAGGIGAFIGYSPYCVPQTVDGVRCVFVDEALRDIEPMAWDFVMNFARDNGLPVSEVCALPEAAPKPER